MSRTPLSAESLGRICEQKGSARRSLRVSENAEAQKEDNDPIRQPLTRYRGTWDVFCWRWTLVCESKYPRRRRALRTTLTSSLTWVYYSQPVWWFGWRVVSVDPSLTIEHDRW